MNPIATFKPVAGEIFAALGRSRRSVADLAEAVGLSESTLRRRLTQPGKLNLEELVAIADALGVRPRDLAEILSKDAA